MAKRKKQNHEVPVKMVDEVLEKGKELEKEWEENEENEENWEKRFEEEFKEELATEFLKATRTGEIKEAREVHSIMDIESPNLFRTLVDHYTQVQKLRVALENRVRAIRQQKDETQTIPAWMVRSLERFYEEEKELTRAMKWLASSLTLYNVWLKHVKGIGPTLAVKLIGLIGSAERFPRVSKLWRYAGLAVIDGKAEKTQKGEKRHYNARLKSLLYVISSSFLKVHGKVYQPYAEIYYTARRKYEAEKPDWTKLHVHYASIRKMEKLFLSHLWHVWRAVLGLPITYPYVKEYLGHKITDPWSFIGVEKPDWITEKFVETI